jgi:uncharacterized membrane protein
MNQNHKSEKKFTLQWMTGTALMIAITLVLANTPLGRITMPFLTATTLHIPVIISTLFLGWEAGVLTGLTFGVHSLISNLTGVSFFAPFFINPLVSVLPRVLFPLCVYGLYKVCTALLGRFSKGHAVSLVLASAAGTALHTTMVMGMIALLYGARIQSMLESGLGVPDAVASHGVYAGIAAMGVTNGVPEMIVAAVIAPVIVLALEKALGRSVK